MRARRRTRRCRISGTRSAVGRSRRWTARPACATARRAKARVAVTRSRTKSPSSRPAIFDLEPHAMGVVDYIRQDKDFFFRTDPHSPIPEAEREAFQGLSYFAYDDALCFALDIDTFL